MRINIPKSNKDLDAQIKLFQAELDSDSPHIRDLAKRVLDVLLPERSKRIGSNTK